MNKIRLHRKVERNKHYTSVYDNQEHFNKHNVQDWYASQYF